MKYTLQPSIISLLYSKLCMGGEWSYPIIGMAVNTCNCMSYTFPNWHPAIYVHVYYMIMKKYLLINISPVNR